MKRTKDQRLKNWEIIWIITMSLWLLTCMYFMMYYTKDSNLGVLKDNWWHIGYTDCERNYNYSFTEIKLVNEYRIYKAENKICTDYNVLCKNGN